mmetsp:Transcript_12433/g.22288  ORF Transcript_12433/g.22288 Transcript_12433/m.22288 type:complete len:1070 (-) Transcript_12433:102-3311(-)
MYDFPGFINYCFGFAGRRCLPIDSLVTYFFPNGNLVNDIDGVLRSFLGNQPALWKLDQNFGPDNLRSNVTRSFVFLRNMGGDQRAAHPFLESLHKHYFWKKDQSNVYSAMVHTWENEHLKKVEANDALHHDVLWSIGSLCFIALMILCKVRSLFVVFFSMLGLVLAFFVSYYWSSVHFAIHNATLLWVAGLFVMLGIGADDIFLMVDSFDHTKVECDRTDDNEDDCVNEQEKQAIRLKILRERLEKAYRKAGSMMLVSSVTTAICFFSNAFGILVVIQEFGIFMGMVVLVNYLHVMTILPSAILVNEIYVIPFQQKLIGWYKEKFPSKQSNKSKESEDDEVALDAETGLPHNLDLHDDSLMKPSSASDGEKLLGDTSKMNRMDRWLVAKYAPFVEKRAVCILCFTLLITIVLGVLGTMHFTLSDGSIVLFSERYNLGRLQVVTDTYFNSDISKTIEASPASKTPSPTPAPNDYDPSPVSSSSGSPGVSLPESMTEGGEQTFVSPPSSGGSNGSGGSGIGTGTSNGSGESPSSFPPDSSSNNNDMQPVEAPTPSFTNVPISQPTPVSGSQSVSENTDQNTDSNQASTNAGTASTTSSQASATGAVPVIPLGPNSDLDLRRRETIHVNLIWGVQPEDQGSKLWKVDSEPGAQSIGFYEDEEPQSTFDLSETHIQAHLLKTVGMARNHTELHVQPDKLTWIEILRDFAMEKGIGFPIPKELFVGYLQLLKERNNDFADLIRQEIGTTSPGLAGDFTFASITIKADAVQSGSASMSETVYLQWTDFANKVNEQSQPNVPKVVAQSRIFLDAYRAQATIDSTVTTWFVANGLCLLVILLFTQNIALSLMVMVTIILIFFCMGGLLFAMIRIPFGPVEALGVSIFIGLSANYSLHVVHAYHHSVSNTRSDKITEAIFAVGSPILASALSTMGACAFLFFCRVYVFLELGILICCITATALLFSMTFLIAWLAVAGPLPFEKNGRRLHRWDLRALWCCKVPFESIEDSDDGVMENETPSVTKSFMTRTIQMDEGLDAADNDDSSDDGSDYSIEINDDDSQESDGEESVYSITVVEA